MWSKHFCRLSKAASRTARLELASAQCGCVRLDGYGSANFSSNQKVQNTQSQDNQRTSNEYLTANQLAVILSGIGISLAAYLMKRKNIHAIEKSAEAHSLETKTKLNLSDTNSVQQKEESHIESKNRDFRDNSSADNNLPPQLAKSELEIDWSTVPELPHHVPYLLIGAGVASLEAFKAIKTKDVKAKVLMIGDEEYPPYFRPALSKNFWFEDDRDSYKNFTYTNFIGKATSVFITEGLTIEPKRLPYMENGGLAFLPNRKVVKLDTILKKVTLDNGAEISFDKCLIATGGSPKNLDVLDKAGEEVKKRTTLFRNVRDLTRLSEISDSIKTIAVVGGGFLGSELAVGLAYRGYENKLKVIQVFPEKGVMAKVLPQFLSMWANQKIKEDGVQVIPNVNIKSAVFEDGQVKLGLDSGIYLLVDHIVVAAGIQANTDLAETAGLEVDNIFGGYKVNAELQACSDIWAAGDCASFYDARLGRRRVEHFDNASIAGRLAGFNMTGEAHAYTHQSKFWCTLGSSVDYEAVGLVDSRLETFSAFRKKGVKEETVQSSSSGTSEKLEGPETTDTSKVEIRTSEADTRTSDAAASETSNSEIKSLNQEDDYSNGVVFYLRDDVIVGIVLWNLNAFSGNPSRMDIAKQIIEDGSKVQDLVEVAKLFNIYAR